MHQHLPGYGYARRRITEDRYGCLLRGCSIWVNTMRCFLNVGPYGSITKRLSFDWYFPPYINGFLEE